jgi:hypothetical protein
MNQIEAVMNRVINLSKALTHTHTHTHTHSHKHTRVHHTHVTSNH